MQLRLVTYSIKKINKNEGKRVNTWMVQKNYFYYISFATEEGFEVQSMTETYVKLIFVALMHYQYILGV